MPSKPTGIFEFLPFSAYLLAIVCLGLYFSVGQFIYPDYKIVHETKIDSTYSYTYIEAKGENEVTMVDSSGKKFVKKINHGSEIGLTGKIKTLKEDLSYGRLIGGGLLAILVLFMFLIMVNSHLRKKSLYKKVKQIADKYDDVNFPERRVSAIMFPFDL